ncbi:hypothetical protein [Shouchella clausii]|uniref:hypothetical protein n=1 Tax=Shouchella clausii TaxID=79880 RepID=UPI001C736035|nr:hypothetical protein [Shouchella clausii]MBX0320139.1 hypothetical protein [Shouchella clausii]
MSDDLLKMIVNKLETIESAQKHTTEYLAKLDDEQQNIINKIDKIETEQQQIKQAVMETNQSVKHLEQIQSDQQRIIELLSARSIQQEAELKRIK